MRRIKWRPCAQRPLWKAESVTSFLFGGFGCHLRPLLPPAGQVSCIIKEEKILFLPGYGATTTGCCTSLADSGRCNKLKESRCLFSCFTWNGSRQSKRKVARAAQNQDVGPRTCEIIFIEALPCFQRRQMEIKLIGRRAAWTFKFDINSAEGCNSKQIHPADTSQSADFDYQLLIWKFDAHCYETAIGIAWKCFAGWGRFHISLNSHRWRSGASCFA